MTIASEKNHVCHDEAVGVDRSSYSRSAATHCDRHIEEQREEDDERGEWKALTGR